MVHWQSYLFGAPNNFGECPQCNSETAVEELNAWNGVCRECYNKNESDHSTGSGVSTSQTSSMKE